MLRAALAALVLTPALLLSGCAATETMGRPDLTLRPFPFQNKGLVVLLPDGQKGLEKQVIGRLNARQRVYDPGLVTGPHDPRRLVFHTLPPSPGSAEQRVYAAFMVARHVLAEPFYQGPDFGEYAARNPKLKQMVELWRSQPTSAADTGKAILHHADLFTKEWGASLDLDAKPIKVKIEEKEDQPETRPDGGLWGRWTW